MDIERCLSREGYWLIETRLLGQPVKFSIANAEISALIDGENPSEVTVLDTLRDHKDALERAATSAVKGSDDRPEAFSSLAVAKE